MKCCCSLMLVRLFYSRPAPESKIVTQFKFSNFQEFYMLVLSNLMSVFYCAFQIIKIFSEDGFGKMVEIPADMTARDLCQLLVYKNHCVDDNSWALVEHHPALGLGNWLASFLSYGGVWGDL